MALFCGIVLGYLAKAFSLLPTLSDKLPLCIQLVDAKHVTFASDINDPARSSKCEPHIQIPCIIMKGKRIECHENISKNIYLKL